VLFPDGGAARDTGAPPRCLVVPDGTWRETRRMLRRLPALFGLPRWLLPAATEPALRLRRAPASGSRSTIEAIAGALAGAGDHEAAGELCRLYHRFAEQGLRARGTYHYHAGGVAGGQGPR
jgi:DTW domain-containing protein YfiP